MVTGLCSALAVMPVGGLVSLVFRVGKVRIPRLPEIVPQFLLATQLNFESTGCINSDNLCMINIFSYCFYTLQIFFCVHFRPCRVVCLESIIKSRCLMSAL